MSQVQMREHIAVEHLPRMFRNRTVDYTLMLVGALAAAFGAYTYFAPGSWVVGGLSEAWYLGSFIGAGVLLAAGLGLLGASIRDRTGYWTTSAITSFVLGTLALAGAVVAVVLLVI
ncbi:MAG: hypothetical protein ACOYX5_10560 [Actinomycetota bacterium]